MALLSQELSIQVSLNVGFGVCRCQKREAGPRLKIQRSLCNLSIIFNESIHLRISSFAQSCDDYKAETLGR